MYGIQKIKLEDVVDIALHAGDEILKVYSGDFEVETKGDMSPLTEADRVSNKVILLGLKKITPDIPVLSEEGKAVPYDARKGWKAMWVVDPLDGTKEFIKRNGEFTVNIALVEEGRPVLGVVYAPAKKLLYYGDKNGSYRVVGDGKPERLPVSSKREGFIVVASRSHMNEETRGYIEKLRVAQPNLEYVSSGSSLKICLVAEGSADAYPRLAPTMEWDTCAAHAIANAAGKKVTRYGTNEELRYNKRDLLNPNFVVE